MSTELGRREALKIVDWWASWIKEVSADMDGSNDAGDRARFQREHELIRRALVEPAVPSVPDAVCEVMNELAEARKKFPQWPDDPIHAAAVVQEEAGELVQAVLQSIYEPDKSDYSHARKEAIQLGAMAIRFIENMELYRTPPKDQHDDRALGAAPEPDGEES